MTSSSFCRVQPGCCQVSLSKVESAAVFPISSSDVRRDSISAPTQRIAQAPLVQPRMDVPHRPSASSRATSTGAHAVPLHLGNAAHPQKDSPTCAPFLAVLRTMCPAHRGHTGVADALLVSVASGWGFASALHERSSSPAPRADRINSKSTSPPKSTWHCVPWRTRAPRP